MTNLYIPKKLMIGYQARKDTYTEKLAYITYIDDSGTHRKQKSWDGWRDHTIDSDSFDNEPIEGFVLNKPTGMYYHSWNNRKSYCRIYDPRGFEFEITFENLLFILEYNNSIKGKGIEGSFVYAWDQKDLVLLPTETQEYKNATEFTALQATKITSKDLIEGCIYKHKNNNTLMYITKVKTYYNNADYDKPKLITKTRYLFKYIDNKINKIVYDFCSNLNNISLKLTDTPSVDWINEYDEYHRSKHSPNRKLTLKVLEHHYNRYWLYIYIDGFSHDIIRHNDSYYAAKYAHNYYDNHCDLFKLDIHDTHYEVSKNSIRLDMTRDEYNNMQKYNIVAVNEHGVECYVLRFNNKIEEE